MVRKLFSLVLMLLCMIVASAQVRKGKSMRLKVTISGHVFYVKPVDDPMVAQVAAMCPMELEVSRSGNHEYYGRLPKKADDSKSRQTSEAHKNELMYFEGWNCLSLLFDDVNVAPYKLVKLGDFEEDISSLLKDSGASISKKIEME